MNSDEFIEKVREHVLELRCGVCPIWQCAGELEYLEERINWQEPDMKCKNCNNIWLLEKK